MRILIVSPEAAPLAKTGGLADVAGSLPAALARQGHEVALAVPFYRQIREQGLHGTSVLPRYEADFGGKKVQGSVLRSVFPKSDIPLYLVDCPQYYDRNSLYGENGQDYPDNLERFSFFCQAVLAGLKKDYRQPHIIHCNDWQTGLLPVYLKTWYRDDIFFRDVKVLYTIHNLAYQGLFPKERLPELHLPWDLFHIDGMEFYGKISLMKAGIVYSDRISTVSEKYAEEIQTKEFGCGLEGVLEKRKKSLVGIINGVDYSIWDPRNDDLIPRKFLADDMSGKDQCKAALQLENGLPEDPSVVLISMISRLADQKGLDMLEAIFPKLMRKKVQFVLLGTGDPKYHRFFEEVSSKYPDKTGVHLAFDNTMAHRIEAGSDLFLMPSRYEPCGLNQMYSLRYGTIPVVRKTGGLADTVKDYDPKSGTGNGFVFSGDNPEDFLAAIECGICVFRKKSQWEALRKRAMQMDFSWDASAQKYTEVYESMVR